MDKNTKILLGLGLIGLAYYLWQKSSKIKGLPSVIKPNEGLGELRNEYCEIMSKALFQEGRELNQDEEMRENQIAKQVKQLGYTGLGFSIVSGVPNCNQLFTIEELKKYPRF